MRRSSILGPDSATSILEAALVGTVCVHAWTGYGDPLFATFCRDGKVPEKPRSEQEPGSVELQTNFSDWLVSAPGGIMDGGPDGRNPPAAAERLVGKLVVHARVTNDYSLVLDLDERTVLRITPWRDQERLTDAWNVGLDNSSVLAVPTFGPPRLVESTSPIHAWFTSGR